MKTHVRDTSLMAWNEVRETLSERQAVVYDLLQQFESLTNEEIGEKLDWKINCVTPRIFELRHEFDPPLVVSDGKRKCTVTGRTAYAWRVIKDTLF